MYVLRACFIIINYILTYTHSHTHAKEISMQDTTKVNKLLSKIKERHRYYKEYHPYSSVMHFNVFSNYFIPQWMLLEEYYEKGFNNLNCSEDELYDEFIAYWKEKINFSLNTINWKEGVNHFEEFALREGEYESNIKVYNFLIRETQEKENNKIIKEHADSGLFFKNTISHVDISFGNGSNLGTTLSLLNTWDKIFRTEDHLFFKFNAIIYDEKLKRSSFANQRSLKDKKVFPIYIKDELLYGVETEYILREFKYYINDDLTLINEKIISFIKLKYNFNPHDVLINVNYMTSDDILESIFSIWGDFAKKMWHHIKTNKINFIILPIEDD